MYRQQPMAHTRYSVVLMLGSASIAKGRNIPLLVLLLSELRMGVTAYPILGRNVWSASPENRKSMFPSVSEGVQHTIGKPLTRRVQNRFVDGLVFDVG